MISSFADISFLALNGVAWLVCVVYPSLVWSGVEQLTKREENQIGYDMLALGSHHGSDRFSSPIATHEIFPSHATHMSI